MCFIWTPSLKDLLGVSIGFGTVFWRPPSLVHGCPSIIHSVYYCIYIYIYIYIYILFMKSTWHGLVTLDYVHHGIHCNPPPTHQQSRVPSSNVQPRRAGIFGDSVGFIRSSAVLLIFSLDYAAQTRKTYLTWRHGWHGWMDPLLDLWPSL